MPDQKAQGLWLNGFSGRMGQEIAALLPKSSGGGFSLLGGSSENTGWEDFASQRGSIQLVMDFSTVAGNAQLLGELQGDVGGCRSILLGTTSLPQEQLEQWRRLAKSSKIAILLAPNTSLGISLALQAALAIVSPSLGEYLDIEISETHHRFKKDAPSGTALFLAERLARKIPQSQIVTNRQGERKKNEIGVHSLRGGGVVGEHVIHLLAEHEEICISHRVFSRSVFAQGALFLVERLQKHGPGFYELGDLT